MADSSTMEDQRTAFFSSVKKMQWLHDRKHVRVPIGIKAYDGLVNLSHGALAKLHAQLLYVFGVQPYVVSPIPPLIQLILYGCGCRRCERARPAERSVRPFMLADEILSFYLLVLSADCTHTSTPVRDASARSDATKKALELLTNAQNEFVAHQQACEETSQRWKTINDELHQQSGDLFELVKIGKELASKDTVAYTLEFIHRIEAIVWVIMNKTVPESEAVDVCFKMNSFLTPLSSIRPYQEIKDAIEAVNASVADQDKTLRVFACGTNDGTQLSEFPDIHFPSNEQLKLATQEAVDNETSPILPIESGCYVAFSVVYRQLLIEKASALISNAARENNNGPYILPKPDDVASLVQG